VHLEGGPIAVVLEEHAEGRALIQGALRAGAYRREASARATTCWRLPMALQDEGSVAFWLQHEHKDWATNNQGYNFPEFGQPPIFSLGRFRTASNLA